MMNFLEFLYDILLQLPIIGDIIQNMMYEIPGYEYKMSFMLPLFIKGDKEPKWRGVITTMEINTFDHGRLNGYFKNIKCWLWNGYMIKTILGKVNYDIYNDSENYLWNVVTTINRNWLYVLSHLLLHYKDNFQKIVVLLDINTEIPLQFSEVFYLLSVNYKDSPIRITYDKINKIIIIKLKNDWVKIELIIRNSDKINIGEMMECISRYNIKLHIRNLYPKDNSKTKIDILRDRKRMKLFNSKLKGYELLKEIHKQKLMYFKEDRS